MDRADDRLFYATSGSLVSIDVKKDEATSVYELGRPVSGLAYDSARARIYVVDDGGLTAIDVAKLVPNSLPRTGGPPASTGGNWPIFVGIIPVSLGCLILVEIVPKRR